MVKLLTFKDYEGYVHAQRRTVRRKGPGPYFFDVEIEAVCKWMKEYGSERALYVSNDPSLCGICHGARNGLEADEFKKHFTGADVIGTDLFPHSGRSASVKTESEVVQHDFSVRKQEWMGIFDWVYSNSLDHALDPAVAIQVWLEQLRPGGHLFVQWSRADTGVKGGDCFGASLNEHMDLMNMTGDLVDLIYVRVKRERGNILRRRSGEVVILVVEQRCGRRRRR